MSELKDVNASETEVDQKGVQNNVNSHQQIQQEMQKLKSNSFSIEAILSENPEKKESNWSFNKNQIVNENQEETACGEQLRVSNNIFYKNNGDDSENNDVEFVNEEQILEKGTVVGVNGASEDFYRRYSDSTGKYDRIYFIFIVIIILLVFCLLWKSLCYVKRINKRI